MESVSFSFNKQAPLLWTSGRCGPQNKITTRSLGRRSYLPVTEGDLVDTHVPPGWAGSILTYSQTTSGSTQPGERPVTACSEENVHVKSVQSVYLPSIIIAVCSSTLKPLNIVPAVVNKLVDQLVVGKDKRLQAFKKLATSGIGHFVYVVDQARDHKTLATFLFTAFSQLTTTTHNNIHCTCILCNLM